MLPDLGLSKYLTEDKMFVMHVLSTYPYGHHAPLSHECIVSDRFLVLLLCCVALRPKSAAMVMAGRSVHLTTLFPGQA